MATKIVFATQRREDRPLSVRVSQSPGDVLSGWTEADGRPFALQRDGGGEVVYVNPIAIAYFEEATGPAGAGGAGGGGGAGARRPVAVEETL